MSTSPSAEHTVPQSADPEYKPLKRLGGGKDGVVILAIPRDGIQNLGSCVALKILKGDNTTSVPKAKLETLKRVQNEDDHLIAAVRDYAEIANPEWHCMTYIPGHDIEHLLDKEYSQHGMPPTLVFHIFAEIFRVQDHLRVNKLTQVDLSAGGNVMLSNKDNDAWPSVTLVDFSGILAYNQQKEVRHVVELIGKMMKSVKSIPGRWLLSSFGARDIEDANKIYEMIVSRANRKMVESGHLTGLWKEYGQKVGHLKQSLKDNVALGDLRNTLDRANTTEADVQRLLQGPEAKMEVEEHDAGMEATRS